MLATGAHRVRLVLDEIEELYSSYEISYDLIGLRNLAHDDRPGDGTHGEPRAALPTDAA